MTRRKPTPKQSDRGDYIIPVLRPRAKPSQITDRPWIQVNCLAMDYLKPTPRSGKWLVFVSTEHLDEMWVRIRRATEQGRLGYASKTATMMPNANARSAETKVICVYTYDSDDIADVNRIREELRALGVTENISYKTDAATRAGRYANRGDKRISKYRG